MSSTCCLVPSQTAWLQHQPHTGSPSSRVQVSGSAVLGDIGSISGQPLSVPKAPRLMSWTAHPAYLSSDSLSSTGSDVDTMCVLPFTQVLGTWAANHPRQAVIDLKLSFLAITYSKTNYIWGLFPGHDNKIQSSVITQNNQHAECLWHVKLCSNCFTFINSFNPQNS